jgi:D-glycero-alpha-D-manno-heptose 1-phosphate guanylyltransferase
MEVIILAGGFGTRLQSVVNNVPKPMANINGKPFLEYLLEYLSSYDITKVILSVGYKQEIIKEYFKNNYKNIQIQYSCEEKPLGTGGAIKKALELIDNDKAIILNGDTFINIDLSQMIHQYQAVDFDIVMGLKKMYNFDRYGVVSIKNDKIIHFKEKAFVQDGYINTGTYIIYKTIFDKIDLDNFSFEDFMQNNIDKLNIYPFFCNNSYFIDIGIPSDYEKCKINFKEIF